MSNLFLTVSQITREALRILHQKSNFIGSINRQYDDSFAQAGAKIGNTLRVRLPNQYTVRTGAALEPQDTTENQVSLSITSQKGVDVQFSSQDLTLSLDDFSTRILEPAMAVLAANIEADALSMSSSVYNQINGMGSAQTFRNILLGRKALLDNLAPMDDQHYCRLCTQDNVDMVDSLKGLFQSSTEIAKQYRDGVLGRTGGFEFAENTIVPSFTNGAGTGYVVNGAGQTGSTIAVGTGTGALNAGQVFTIAGVFRVHPETKQNTGALQQFVVTTAYAGGAGNLSISPAIITTGGTQNVTGSPASGAALTLAGSASETYGQSLAYHKDAFTFATADLIMPKGVDMAAREVFDGISMRIVRQYDINSDNLPCRIDVLYGYQAIRPQLAVRLAAN